MRRTSANKERQVLSLILTGRQYADISKATGIPISTIKKIKQRHDKEVVGAYAKAAEAHVSDVNSLLNQANRQISKLLTKAEIGTLDISVTDLCRISNAMYAQTTASSSPFKSLKTLETVAKKYQ